MSLFWRASFFLFAAVVLIAPTHASTYRLAAVGNESRLLADDTNIFLYPGTIAEFPHIEVDLFGDWGGGIYPLANSHVFGLFLNRTPPQLERLNAYLGNNGSRAFRQLEARPWMDVFYGWRRSGRLHLGLAGRFAYDRLRLNTFRASAWQGDLRFGLRWGNAPGKILDAAWGLTAQRLEDTPMEDASTLAHETDGNGYLLDLRLRWPLTPQIEFEPSLGYEYGAYALAPDQRDFRILHLNAGLNARPTPGILVLVGLIVRYEKSELVEPGRPRQEETDLLAPAIVGAGEIQVGSMVFRLGLRHENRLTDMEEMRDDALFRQEDFHTAFKIDLGLGFEFGSLLIDGLLERDFLRDGPHIIGGSRHGGGLFSAMSLTYRFSV